MTMPLVETVNRKIATINKQSFMGSSHAARQPRFSVFC